MLLHHIALICSNKERTVKFYNTLGFKIINESVRENDELILLGGNGVILEVFVKSDCPQRLSYPEAYGLRHIAFETDCLDEIYEKLSLSGYEPEELRISKTSKKIRLFFVKDPDGVPIEISENPD